MKLRYSEAFYSVQGEGRFVGVPSVFLRTFGCNFRCMNFGLAKDEPMRDEKLKNGIKYNPEVKALLDDGVLNKVNKFEDLPIIHTGCDTYASIYPEFKKYMMDRSIDEVVDHVLSLTPEKKWTMSNGQDVHFILTGGEQLLGWQKLYIDLFEHPRMQDLKNVMFETNTTQKLHPDFAQYSIDPRQIPSYLELFQTFLHCESWSTAIQPEIARSTLMHPVLPCIRKFVLWLVHLMWTKFPEQYRNTMESVLTFQTGRVHPRGRSRRVSTQHTRSGKTRNGARLALYPQTTRRHLRERLGNVRKQY